MTPEVWVAIRQDWKESLPAILAGEDDKFYTHGWAQREAPPKTVKTSFHYVCSQMRWAPSDMKSAARDANMCFKRDALSLALWRKHNTSIMNLARVMHRDHSTMSAALKRARDRMDRRPDFADLVKRLEAML